MKVTIVDIEDFMELAKANRAHSENAGEAFNNRRILARHVAKVFKLTPDEEGQLIAYSTEESYPSPHGASFMLVAIKLLKKRK